MRGAPPLPIDTVLPSLREALARGGSAVLVAPPGAGKTTRVPLHLLHEPWVAGGRVIVLEPRRIAARAAAVQMSRLLGEEVGGTVGYRVRLERRTSARTRIEVVTEGILTRMVQDDPALEGIAAVIFDEFHERHLTADLGLALTLESRQVLRPDLRVLVMSATLDAAPVAELLDAPVIVSEGRAFPVETRWRPPREATPLPVTVAGAVRECCADDSIDGDLLVFLPGHAELHRVRAALEASPPAGDPEVLLLHGGLTLGEQDIVLRSRGTRRRVVLSTAIAESSVTLDGVRTVVDAGLARVPRFSPRSGMTRLETTRVSRASADQRRGRAGRTASGICVRLWSEGTHAQLLARAVPEILEADLAPLALELACAGIADPTALRWLDLPPDGALAQARSLLTDLGALDEHGRATAHGRKMAVLGVVPRLAHLVLTAHARGLGTLGCEIAALLGERDVLRRESAEMDADLTTRVELVRGRGPTGDADRGRLERVRQEAKALRRSLPEVRGVKGQPDDDRGHNRTQHDDDLAHVGALVALAYPDRVAMRRAGEAPRFLLRNGRGARLATSQRMGASPFLAIADLDGDPAESRIWLAAPLDEEGLRESMADAIVTERVVAWDANDTARVVERERLGALVLRERPVRDADPELVTRALLERVRQVGVGAIRWSESAMRIRQRLAFAHLVMPEEYPDVSDDALLAELDAWLAPLLGGMRRLADLANADLGSALLGRLGWGTRARLDELAPTHVEVPSGSRIGVDYGEPSSPVLAVRLQELFGLADTPRVGMGRVPLTLHLLSPAHRPVQVTRDLANFWRTTYFEVRKDLKGRYPRHPWPDSPMDAVATRRVKPRGT
ncbi:MAG: ATP-dependent helicase HrpB [Gemmatimonadaceae bacterium]